MSPHRLTPRQRSAVEAVAEGRFYPDLVREDDGWHARWKRSDGAEDPWLDGFVREAAVTPLTGDAEDQRHETLHDAWAMALRSRTGLVRWDDAQCAAFAGDLKAWHGNGVDDAAVRQGIVFRFVAEAEGAGKNAGARNGGTPPGRFEIRCAVPRGAKALRALGQSVYVFGPLRAMRRDGKELAVALNAGEAEAFLRTGARDLRIAGYGVADLPPQAEVTAEADLVACAAAGRRDAGPAEGKTRAKLVVRVAGEAVTAGEIRFLLEQGTTFVFFRNRWIEVDRNILREALRALERCDGQTLSPARALAFASGIGAVGRLELAAAHAHGGLRAILGELRKAVAAAQGARSRAAWPGLKGRLRPYQARGAAWMGFLTDRGFGALLADDMGLGKTVQVIAWILSARRGKTRQPPVLVAAPLTLLSNWAHEFAKFAPSLKVLVHQGEGRVTGLGFSRVSDEADVVVTSYTLLVRDYRDIRSVAWSGLVLDEAQAVKNPDTQAARAVRALGVRRRVALTGTPVENSVADIWSLEEFLNPGFLGDRRDFAERFVKPLAVAPLAAAGRKLRRALEPFVLRRLKDDGEIAGELGPKREVKEYCALAPRERADYEAALADWRAGERRKGDVFALLTRLKLVCDGFADGARLPPDGGKALRLAELARTIFEQGESVLVFTQYAKVGAALRTLLAENLRRRVFFLHGGLTAREREEEIAAFDATEGPAAFVLSLKAGGFGLNLVKATHVVHYDRWWNPAAESQATDRAHRIGQSRTVFVHTFIAAGTVEEHVDAILERKQALAGSLVTTGEALLGGLSAAEFDRAVSLDESWASASPLKPDGCF